jgi:hypothetical protein
MSKETYLKPIVEAFKRLHGCEAIYLETIPVVETFQGKTVWEGDVEVFGLKGHPKASKGYGWTFTKDNGIPKTVAVLELPPVISPKTAVQAALISETKKGATRFPA